MVFALALLAIIDTDETADKRVIIDTDETADKRVNRYIIAIRPVLWQRIRCTSFMKGKGTR